VTARLSLREKQIFVTGHSVLRHSQKLQTRKRSQAHTIQIVRAHAHDLTIAAAGIIIRQHQMHELWTIAIDDPVAWVTVFTYLPDGSTLMQPLLH